MPEVRARRDQCHEAAEVLSYLRRQVQGRLDIVHADLERRAGGEPGDLSELVSRLERGEILSDSDRPGGFGRLPSLMDAPAGTGWIAQELDAIVGPGRLGDLPALSDDEIRQMADALSELERRVSERRAALHDRTDALQAEIVRRYKSGEASVDSLLR